MKEQPKNQSILVTGGTSGLGLELVHILLQRGYHVVATGRKQIELQGFEENLTLYIVDFSDLNQVAEVTRMICRKHSFNYIVNNAGILSPPGYIETIDGLEYTFQVNFLAHLLINRIILNGITTDRKVGIISVTSPVYRLADLNPGIKSGSADYRPLRSYSSSKLYLAMMCEFLPSRYKGLNLQCFSYDPGTFSSGIYRMQKRWFIHLYRIAAPFMRRPAAVAKVLAELLLEDSVENGMIYDNIKRQRSLPEMDKSLKASFMDSCYSLIDPFLL